MMHSILIASMMREQASAVIDRSGWLGRNCALFECFSRTLLFPLSYTPTCILSPIRFLFSWERRIMDNPFDIPRDESDTPAQPADGPIDHAVDPDDVDAGDTFADDAVRYRAAKAEVARLAVRLGIAGGTGDRAAEWGGLSVTRSARATSPSPVDREDLRGAGRGDGSRCLGPTGFGRGWIPVGRDLGLPFDKLRVSGGEGAESPLLFRGGDLGVVADAAASAAGFASGRHHPLAPSSEEEGGMRTPRPTDFTPPRRALSSTTWPSRATSAPYRGGRAPATTG